MLRQRNAARCKSKILLHQGKLSEALAVFSSIYEAMPKHIAEDYAHEFANLIYFPTSQNFDEATTEFEKHILENALIECGGIVSKAADKLHLSTDSLIKLLVTKHTDIGEKFKIGNFNIKNPDRFA